MGEKIWSIKCGRVHSAQNFNSAVSITKDSEMMNFNSEDLSEIEPEFENTLAGLSGAWMGSNH